MLRWFSAPYSGNDTVRAICVILIVFSLVFGLLFFAPVLFLLPSIHGVLAVYMKREDRKHREIVEAIERHGPPPGWR